MRRRVLWLFLLLALPGIARADETDAAGSLEWESIPAIAPSANAAPALDLSFDGALPAGQLSGVQKIRPVAPLAAASRPDRTVEGPFSVGVDIKTRRNVGSPAARATVDQEPSRTLTDQVEGVVRRSTFGLTGTYRF